MNIYLFFRHSKSELLRRYLTSECGKWLFSPSVSLGKASSCRLHSYSSLPLSAGKKVGWVVFSIVLRESRDILRQCALPPGALLPHQLELLAAEKHCSEARLPDWRLYSRRVPLKLEGDFYCAFKPWVLLLKSSNIDNRKIDR